MTITDFKKKVLAKSSGRIVTQVPDEEFIEKVNVAIFKVMNETTPLNLIIQGTSLARKYRQIDADIYLRYPVTCTDVNSILDIDDDLLDAVALYVLASLEPQRGNLYMALFYEQINDKEKRLIEQYLIQEENQNVNRRSNIFP